MATPKTRKPATRKPTASKSSALTKMTLLSAITSSAMLKPERLPIPELNGDVFVKRMTLGERDQYFEDMKEVTKAGGNGNAQAFIYAIATEDGEPMFTLADIEEVKSLPPVLTLSVINEFNIINRFINRDDGDEGADENEDGDLKNS